MNFLNCAVKNSFFIERIIIKKQELIVDVFKLYLAKLGERK